MIEKYDLVESLLTYIYKSPTAFHSVENATIMLSNCGFSELMEYDNWRLEKGGKYFVTRNDSTIIAFVIGTEEVEREGFRIIGAHTDSPTFRIKPNAEIIAEDYYVKLNIETYGEPILSTWMDRPLSVAGRVVIRNDKSFPCTHLVKIEKPVLVIPNLAIHFNRELKSGIELNKQRDMQPLMSLISNKLEQSNYLIDRIAEVLNVNPSEIADFDLFLYEVEKGSIIGLNDDFILSPRLDDLAMVHAGLVAISRITDPQSTCVLACFDNEEVGSITGHGAGSQMLPAILERIIISAGGKREDYFRSLSKSFMISADLAHAVHPNLGEKYDPTNRALINKGPVIKINANMRYSTDSVSSYFFTKTCESVDIPYQWFVNRSDEKGGSTIGPKLSSILGIKSIDVGTPILAMHSARELGGVMDHFYITSAFDKFYR